MGIFKGFAVISSAVVALSGSLLLAVDPLTTHLFFGYPTLGYLAVGGSWVATLCWATDRRLLAVPAHIVSVFAPWGYLYPLPVAAVVLALLAGATFRSSQASPSYAPDTPEPEVF
jgi:hypothetical protein